MGGFAVLASFIGIRGDSTPPHFDSAYNLLSTLKVERGLSSRGPLALFGYDYYPHGVRSVASLAMRIGGESYQSVLLANVVWIVGLVAALIALGRRLQLGNAGRCVLFGVVIGAPMVIGAWREYIFDVPSLVTWIAFLAVLAALPDRPDRTAWVRVGAAILLAMWVKWPAMTWIAAALLAETLWRRKLRLRLRVDKGDAPATRRTWAIFLTIAAVCVPWYLIHLVRLAGEVAANGVGAGISEGDPQGFGWGSLSFYLRSVTDHFVTLPIIVSVGVLIIAEFVRKVKGDATTTSRSESWVFWHVAVIAGVNLAYLIQQANKDGRYLMPMLPLAAMVLAVLADRAQKIGMVVAGGIIATCVVNIATISLPLNVAPRQVADLTVIADHGYTSTRPVDRDWVHDQIIERVRQHQKQSGCERTFGVFDQVKRLRLNGPSLAVPLVTSGWRVTKSPCVGIVVGDPTYTTRQLVFAARELNLTIVNEDEWIDDPDTGARIWMAGRARNTEADSAK